MNLKEYLLEKRTLVDKALGKYLPETDSPRKELYRAMRYSLFAGGKRIRPVLCIAAAEAVGGSYKDVMPVACAFEMIHTYSLIHDDLPAMDNDELRRGKPTNHMVFGEAMAILAGDGLLTEAFRIIACPGLVKKAGAERFRKVIEIVASASGADGMVGGQALDIMAEGKKIDTSLMETIHEYKTGALLKASVTAGAILGGGSDRDIEYLEEYGKNIGLAFQISDDILDIEGDSKEMGKQTGVDIERGKNTYPSVYGMERSKILLKEIIDNAIDMLSEFKEKAEPLRQIAVYIIERKK
ncbi:MAG: polyprenyl synthetase family protein [Deltaproteobacteria bacterium]|nr:polyprenyl synthetase family protein [Deltaproteobacteria bacterium]